MKLLFLLCAFLVGAVFTLASDSSKSDVNLMPSGSTNDVKPDDVRIKQSEDVKKPKDTNPQETISNASKPDSIDQIAPHSALQSKPTTSETEPSAHKTKEITPESSPTAMSPGEHKSTPKSTESTISPATDIPVDPTDDAAGDWNVTDKNNLACIKVHGIISVTVTVLKNSTLNEMFTIDIAPRTKVNGSCDTRTIRWILNPNTDESLEFEFGLDNSSKEFYLLRVDGLLFSPTNKSVGFRNDTLKALVTPMNRSYLCHDTVKEHLVHSDTRDIVLTLKNFQIQAFKSSKSNGFDESIDGCPNGSHGTPDIVPIIVGCALAILVVVVLVAYLINRRRSQAHGYLSM